MLLATALALLTTGCAQQTFTVQKQTGSSSTKGNHGPSFRFWNWAEENWSMYKICGGAEKMLLNRNPANITNGLLGFIT